MKKMCTRKFSILAILTAFAITGFSQTIPPDIRDMMPGNSATAAPDKKPGVIRIGVSSPVAEMGKDFNFADAPMAIRNTLEVALTDDNVEVIFLESALPEKEAKLKKCDYIFISKVTRKKGGGGFGGMGMLGGMAGMIPGVGGIAGAVAATAAATAISVASMSGGFKSKDEVSFEYRVTTVEGAVIIPPTVTKQKAKKDGEDVLTPQIAQAAKLTLERVMPPKPEQ